MHQPPAFALSSIDLTLARYFLLAKAAQAVQVLLHTNRVVPLHVRQGAP